MPPFERPWHIVALIGAVVVFRALIPRIPGLGRARTSLLEFGDALLIALLIVFCLVRPFVLQAFYIPSGSMIPTLQEHDRIIVLKFWYQFAEPQAGDIVVFRAPTSAYYSNPTENPDLNEQKDFIKRLVGQPGDRLAVHDMSLYRNGERLDESYINDAPYALWPRDTECGVVVPPDQYVMMGDNRNNSNDSTKWSYPTMGQGEVNAPFVSRDAIMGKACLIFFPFDRMGWLR